MEQTRIRIYRKELPRGAEKEEWEAVLARLQAQGIDAECILLAAGQTVEEAAAAEFLAEVGAAGLPLIVIDREAVISGRYPAWEELRISGWALAARAAAPAGNREKAAGDAAAVQAEAPKETGNRQERVGTAMGIGPF